MNSVDYKNGTLLNEAQSRQVLQDYHIPLVDSKVVSTIDEAVSASHRVGFPLVLKGLTSALSHKSDAGLVRIGLLNTDSVKTAAQDMLDQVKTLDGFILQPQIIGKREFVVGLFQDHQFGPVIMFGVGGIFTESIHDVVFRLAPLSESDAIDMIHSIRSQSLLGSFRGEKPINTHQLVQILCELSNLSIQRPDIAEIDINPLLADSSGELTAVDALVLLKPADQPSVTKPSFSLFDLGKLYYPESIAFIGASGTFAKWGHMLLTNTISGGYKGKVFFVNAKGGEIAGRPVYQSIKDIPEQVDLGIVTIPASHVLDLIPQFQEKGIKGMLLISSGFKETGQEGYALEQKLVDAAFNAGIIVLGPNTMGICNPHIQFYCTASHAHPIPGSTVLVAQSGNMGTQLLSFAERQGIGIRAFSGSGNEAMVTIEDYMEAFELDKLTRTIVLYIESVKNGRRFFESARKLSKSKKPVVILKGGRTDAGGRAAASHTGAMAQNARIFDAMCTQAGIIQARQPEDLLDLSAVFSSLPMPSGNRVAIMTLGGGWGVVTADLCAEYGLEVPALSSSIIETFDSMLPSYWSRSNPLDLVGDNNPKIPMIGLETLLKWDGCDAVLHLGIHGKHVYVKQMIESILVSDPNYTREQLTHILDRIALFEKKYIAHIVNLMTQYHKPVLGVSLLTDENQHTLHRVDDMPYKGVLFPSPERAVKALSKMCAFQSWINRHL